MHIRGRRNLEEDVMSRKSINDVINDLLSIQAHEVITRRPRLVEYFYLVVLIASLDLAPSERRDGTLHWRDQILESSLPCNINQ